MIVGVPKEIKTTKPGWALPPRGQGAAEAGHGVLVETQAGAQSGFRPGIPEGRGRDRGRRRTCVGQVRYGGQGQRAHRAEYGYFREGLVLFTYLHLAPRPDLTEKLLESKVIGIAYETVRDRAGHSAAADAHERSGGTHERAGGRGYLRRSTADAASCWAACRACRRRKSTILGGGIVGTNAARIALGFGAKVTLMDVNLNRLRELDDIFGGRLYTLA